jgi:hypothetical protein
MRVRSATSGVRSVKFPNRKVEAPLEIEALLRTPLGRKRFIVVDGLQYFRRTPMAAEMQFAIETVLASRPALVTARFIPQRNLAPL